MFIFFSAQPPKDAPRNIRDWFITRTSLICRFDQVSDGGSNGDITGYKVYYRPASTISGANSIKTMNVSSSSTSFILTGLKEDQEYHIWMTAVNSAGEGPKSQTQISRTAKAPSGES